MRFAEAVEWAGTLMEAVGTATMIVGAVVALALAGRALLRQQDPAPH